VTDTVPSTEEPRTGTPVTAGPSTFEIDLAIAVVAVALGAARRAEERCPSGENAQRVAEVRAAVDALLDQRLAAAA
jgi:hypothetical protein